MNALDAKYRRNTRATDISDEMRAAVVEARAGTHKLVLKIGPTNRERVKARNCWKLAAEMALEQPEDGLLQSAGGGVESKAVGAAQGQPHGVACECAEVVDQIGVGANRIVSGRLFTWRRQLLAAAVEPWQRGRVRAPRCPDALCSPQHDPCYRLFWVVLVALPCTTFAEDGHLANRHL
jgi:hypothetical protein